MTMVVVFGGRVSSVSPGSQASQATKLDPDNRMQDQPKWNQHCRNKRPWQLLHRCRPRQLNVEFPRIHGESEDPERTWLIHQIVELPLKQRNIVLSVLEIRLECLQLMFLQKESWPNKKATLLLTKVDLAR